MYAGKLSVALSLYRSVPLYPDGVARAISRIHMGHVRSESQSVQYVRLDIWTSCTQNKHIKIKVHRFTYGTGIR